MPLGQYSCSHFFVIVRVLLKGMYNVFLFLCLFIITSHVGWERMSKAVIEHMLKEIQIIDY